MWFNEDDDFDDNETIVPAGTTDILSKKIDTDLDSIGKIIEKKVENNGPKMNNNSSQKSTVLNNNANSGAQPPSSPAPTENKSALFKRVSMLFHILCIHILLHCIIRLGELFRVWLITKVAIRTKKKMKTAKCRSGRASHST